MVVWGSNVEDGQLRDVISGPAYIELQEQTGTFEHIAALHSDAAYLLVDGRPEVLEAIEVTVDFFRVLGVAPAWGRLFEEQDRTSGAPRTVIVTWAFWRDRLESDPGVIGTTLPFEGEAATLVGVLPEGFEFVAPAPLFIPLRDDVLAADEPGRIHYNVVARLVPGATIADASADLGRVARRFAERYPGFEGWGFLVEPLHEATVEAVRPVIWALAATVLLVLVVALVNLATLFRIRAMARGVELGVRVALGAGWGRVARVLSLETVGLAVLGATLGLMVTPFLLERVAEIVPEWIAIPESASRVPVLRSVLDPAVAAVAFGSALLGALLLTAPSLVSTLAGASTRRSPRVHGDIRHTRLLVGVEVALATVLCLGAALVARSAGHLLSVDVGMEHEPMLTLYYGDLWGVGADERVAYFRQTVEAVEAIPGVRRAGVIGYIDFQAEDDYARVYFLDRELQPVRDMREEWRRVDQGLFEAAGMRMVDGRGFEADDFVGTPHVAVVNQAFATKHWPGASPVGAMLSTHNEHYRDLRIVGVVADVRSLGPAAPAPPMLYVPYQGDPRGTQGMYVRVAGDPTSYPAAIRDAVWSVDPSQPIAGIWPMSAFVGAWVAVPRATRMLLVALALLALLLSAVGVFGVVSYAVRTGRSELGVRLALGATPEQLERQQIRSMLPLVLLGAGVGAVAGVFAARAARSLLFAVSPLDPISVGGALLAMGATALLASYLPARRVGRIDPAEAMRSE
jgi:predicted permease